MNDIQMNSIERRVTWAIGAVFSLRMLGVFMVLPVLTTYGMELQDASKKLIGLAIGIYGLTQAIFQIPFGLFSDRINRRLLIILGLLLFSIGSVIAALSNSIWGIIVARALQGAGAISSALMALLSDFTREQNCTKAIAFIGISFGITFTIAMVLGPIITQYLGLHALFWMMALLTLISIFLMIWIIPNSKTQILNREYGMVKGFFRKVLTDSRLLKLNLGIMILHALLMLTFLAIPKQLVSSGIPSSDHWKVYLFTMIISIIFAAPLIIYSEKKFCMKRIFLLSIVLIFIAEIVLWCTAYFLELAAGIQIFFFSFNLLEAMLPSFINKESPAGYKGTAMGVYSTCQFIGIAIGGFLGGWVESCFSSQTLFFTGALLTIVWLIVASTMKEPPYVSNIRIKIPDDVHIIDLIKRYLDKKEGIREVLVVAEERSAYIKIDRKLTNRFEIEKMLDKVLKTVN